MHVVCDVFQTRTRQLPCCSSVVVCSLSRLDLELWDLATDEEDWHVSPKQRTVNQSNNRALTSFLVNHAGPRGVLEVHGCVGDKPR